MRIVRLNRSTWLVEIMDSSGLPKRVFFLMPILLAEAQPLGGERGLRSQSRSDPLRQRIRLLRHQDAGRSPVQPAKVAPKGFCRILRGKRECCAQGSQISIKITRYWAITRIQLSDQTYTPWLTAMAKTDPANFQLTVAGKTDFVDAISFLNTARDALLALNKVDECVSKIEGGSLEWKIVNATANSPVTFELQSRSTESIDQSDSILNAFLTGLEQIDRDATAPKEFSLPVVAAIKKFAEHFGNGVGKVTFVSRERRYSPSAKLLSNAISIAGKPTKLSDPVAKPSYYEVGVIDGTVENLIGHNQLYFSLFDSLAGNRVKCNFDKELSETVRQAWKLRVAVEGKIRFSLDGVPLSMRVGSIQFRDDLPQFKGTYVNITGGMLPADYVRGLRDND